MVYSSLIAAVSDASHPSWRARSESLYRFSAHGAEFSHFGFREFVLCLAGADEFVELGLDCHSIAVLWIRKTIRKVTIVVPVLMMSCRVCAKLNAGPLTAPATKSYATLSQNSRKLDGRMVELFVIANDGTVKVPVAVAMAAHVQIQRLPEGWRVEPVIEERCWEFLNRARLDAGLPPVRCGPPVLIDPSRQCGR
jgi:hypothetical protein